MDDENLRRVGEAFGEAINTCFEAIARIDGIPVTDVVDAWIQEYLTAGLHDARSS